MPGHLNSMFFRMPLPVATGLKSWWRHGGAVTSSAVGPGHGRAVQVDRIKPELKAPGANLLTLKYDTPLSSFVFKFNLRRYTTVDAADCHPYEMIFPDRVVARCRLPLSNPR